MGRAKIDIADYVSISDLVDMWTACSPTLKSHEEGELLNRQLKGLLAKLTNQGKRVPDITFLREKSVEAR